MLSQEVLRRLRNTRRDLPWSEKAEILSEFSHKLMCSGSSCPITVPLLFSYCPHTVLWLSCQLADSQCKEHMSHMWLPASTQSHSQHGGSQTGPSLHQETLLTRPRSYPRPRPLNTRISSPPCPRSPRPSLRVRDHQLIPHVGRLAEAEQHSRQGQTDGRSRPAPRPPLLLLQLLVRVREIPGAVARGVSSNQHCYLCVQETEAGQKPCW